MSRLPSRPARRPLSGLVATAVALAVPAALVVAAPATSAPGEDEPAPRRSTTQVSDTSFDAGHELRPGRRVGTKIARGSVRLKKPTRSRTHDGRRYDVGVWTSPWVSESFGFTELIPSWQATTPGDSWIEVKARVRAADGTTGSWDTMARWTSGNRWVRRTTLGSQDDDLARVAVDTLKTHDAAGAVGWQLKVQLMRRSGTRTAPSLDRVGAMASRVGPRGATSAPGTTAGTVIDVPAYSQMTHRGHYPQYGNGGEAWCSPTSLAMVLEHYGVVPAAARTFAGGRHTDALVDHTAQQTYDHGYRGTGNWAFNTAYAGTLLPRTSVTRLRDLRAAEQHIAVGTPLIVSVAFSSGQLGGAPIRSTAGHLMVLVGFTASGDVVVNDPAAPTNSSVRRTYDRAQFEQVWLDGSGGLTYLLED
ncbi:peptidase C39 family protein [Nocardioides campestrisoli]|uniref:peptidase C39 family protein n=1 Tax=Nocardioides campestrisoli TaxID=2736757 RepID=UPI0015E642CC|nr:peptidase C39 family protein [Nocardioides campestrisoli]